jgi:hypothetical protein
VLADKNERYVITPKIESYESYEYMRKFVELVEDKELQERLSVALDKKRPFRQFKDALHEDPEEEKKWFKFKEQEIKKEIVSWLAVYGIEFI